MTQVLCSTLVFREDMDIGTVVLGDLQRKSKCIKLRVEEMVEGLKQLRSIQLHLMNCGLGLEDATDDIAPDIDCTKALLGDLSALAPGRMGSTMLGFVADVEEPIGLDSLDAIPLPSQRQLDGMDHINTQDLSLTQLHNELEGSPMRCVSSPPPLSPHELLCTMHSKDPCSPTPIKEGLAEGPWFSRTPSLILAIGPPGARTTVSPARIINLDDDPPHGSACNTCLQSSDCAKAASEVAKNNDSCVEDASGTLKNNSEGSKNSTGVSPPTPTTCSHASEIVEHDAEVKDNSPPTPVAKDRTLDDVLGRTIHKSDGR